MNDSDSSNLSQSKERTPLNQVMTCKAPSMERIIQVVQRAVQRMVQKSCERAYQLFCCPVDTQLRDVVTCCHQHTEDKTAQVALQNMPSTILIVNISNSTLIDCVIGKDTYLSTVAESQPLMQESDHQMRDQVGCSCSRGQQVGAQTSAPPSPTPFACPHLPSAEPPGINIHSSQLNYVIIGDNNYMHAEQTLSAEPEEPQV